MNTLKKLFSLILALAWMPLSLALGAGQNAFTAVKELESALALVGGGDATTGTYNVAGKRGLSFAVLIDTLAVGNVTAVKVEESWDGGTTWTTLIAWTAVPITADGFYRQDATTVVGPMVRFVITSAAGVTGNAAAYVGYIDPSMDHPRSP